MKLDKLGEKKAEDKKAPEKAQGGKTDKVRLEEEIAVKSAEEGKPEKKAEAPKAVEKTPESHKAEEKKPEAPKSETKPAEAPAKPAN